MHMYGDADKIVQCILKGCHIISVMNMWEWWIKKQSNWLARAEEIALKKTWFLNSCIVSSGIVDNTSAWQAEAC